MSPTFIEARDMAQWPTVCLGGLPITRVDRATVARGFIDRVLHNRHSMRRPFYSTSANGEVLALYRRAPEMIEEFASADHILADGMPMVLYSRFFGGTPLPERVATTDLVHDVAKLAVREKVSFYFLGATERVNALAVERMKSLHPGLIFAGRHSGYFTPGEEEALIDEINESRADILWVGMGIPLEQRFIRRNLDKLRYTSVVKSSGGLFDFLSGDRARAPRWMQIAGFEWAFRAWLEPRRLGPRYLATNGVALHRLFFHSR
ncbi:WecB/TagA/CpsF family glycosyltransferase [Aureimonas sp. AU12]|uniref:WecB/TagA/CpsF family glycosyltransferase n=1 Tax=Aureimonas sp. AU12 TaxID=1638161 RepID=UPI00244E7368|nr:WecB/TagA/CpsF family glycosyltransferase [Aureimonas sp. AU12]